jgi:hypothetical protein
MTIVYGIFFGEKYVHRRFFAVIPPAIHYYLFVGKRRG